MEFADLLVWEVYNASDQLTDQPFGRVVHRDLGRCFQLANFWPKIHPNLKGSIACFRIWLCIDDAANADVNVHKLIKC